MIRNIIFDFGGVFFNLDMEATGKMMIQLGLDGITPDLMEHFISYEKGLMSTETFLKRAKKWLPAATEEELREAWNAILLDFPEYRLQFLERLAKSETYRLFLLSNTNALHLEEVEKKMGSDAYQRFLNAFEYCYFSHEVHMRKPDGEIFSHVLESSNLDPAETIFIDDTEEHVRTAARIGLKVWHLKVGAEDIVEIKSRL